jgi:nitroreductase
MKKPAPTDHEIHELIRERWSPRAFSSKALLQATAIGLGVHQMAGFSAERARELYAIPDDFEPVAAIAIGHPGNLDDLPEDLRKRERASRARRSQAEFVFTEAWGKPL